MSKDTKNKKYRNIFILISLMCIFLSINLISETIFLNSHDKNQNYYDKIHPSNSDYNVLNFWSQEINRVNETNLNITFGKNSTLKYTKPISRNISTCTIQEIYFDSPNWVNATPALIKLHGYLLYPEKRKSKNPGCLCMHGLGNQANKSFELAFVYLEKGFIVLCHSHPGHGISEGAKPTSNNFYYKGNFNQSSHNYLTICGAIQGLRILENLTSVNNSQIIVTGTSYGGLNTMWLSGICGDRILSANPIISLGNNRKLTRDPTKLLFWIWNINPNNIPSSFWSNQNLRLDPIYYLRSSKTPTSFFIIGTNDEFFDYNSIKTTFDATNTTNKYLQIHPNGHHVIFDYKESIAFFIESMFNHTIIPPNILENRGEIKTNIIGSEFYVNLSVQDDSNIYNIQVSYKYINLLGVGWETIDLTKIANNIWEGLIPTGLFTSKVDYFIIINLEGQNIWFTSNIYNAGILNNNFSLILYILFINLALLPIIIIIWRRYQKNFASLEERTKKKAQKYLIIELSSILAVDILFYSSLLLPFTNFGNNGVSWSTIHLFNHIFTWKEIFGQLTLFFTPLFFLIFILNTYICYVKPIIASVLKFFYFIFMLLVYLIFYNLIAGSADLSTFGSITLGIGFYLILIESIGLFIIGIYKRKYKTDFKMRTAKKKLYNIDRWFRIKNN